MTTRDIITARIEEYNEQQIDSYGSGRAYNIQEDNGTIALLQMINGGDGEYSCYVYIHHHAEMVWAQLTEILAAYPTDGSAWTDLHWEKIEGLFVSNFNMSIS